MKLLNKDILVRLDKLYPDNNITIALNSVCLYLKEKDYEKINNWINEFYHSLSGNIDIKFKTNYNIWKLKNVQYFNASYLNKLICSFYQFINDEISLVEEHKKVNMISLDLR